MFSRLGQFVSRYWWLAILGWVLVVAGVVRFAPQWDDVTYDGDFAYLPDHRPTVLGEKVSNFAEWVVHIVRPNSDFAIERKPVLSVLGEKLLDESFPKRRSRSQLVLVVARDDHPLVTTDRFVADELARRFHNLHAAAKFATGKQLDTETADFAEQGDQAAAEEAHQQASLALADALKSLQEAVWRNDEFANDARLNDQFAIRHHNLAVIKEYLAGRKGAAADLAPLFDDYYYPEDLEEIFAEAQGDREKAGHLDPDLQEFAGKMVPEDAGDTSIVDVWSRHTLGYGDKLESKDKQAQLVIVRLADEFMATENIALMEKVYAEVDEVRTLVEAFYAERRELNADAFVKETKKLDETEATARANIKSNFNQELNGLTGASVEEIEKFEAKYAAIEAKLERYLDREREKAASLAPNDVTIGISGSAAVGGDMLIASVESISNTERYAVLLVLLILLVVYRSPLLVAVPLATIVVSVVVATGIVAALTQLGTVPGFDWWTFKIFKTTRIFVVVILYGAGTDYCLFLISRYKEELDAGYDRAEAIARALTGVGDALVASALTTVLGLAMMFFADFGKFSNSGPAIGVCLLVTLAASMTLAPALLRAFGGAIFWPFAMRQATPSTASGDALSSERAGSRFWRWAADRIVARPGLILVVSVLVLSPMAYFGGSVDVTYDLQSELEPSRPCRVGTSLLNEHFPVGESGPIIVVAKTKPGALNTNEGEEAIRELTRALYLDGVMSVRSKEDPLGEWLHPDKTQQFSIGDTGKVAIRKHRRTQEVFLAPRGDVTRLEVILEHEPFSDEAATTLAHIDERMQEESNDKDSFWHNSQFAYAGTTAAIEDLRNVTERDNARIKVLVVLAVLAVLIAILKRPIVCLYLIASVLLSYYVTMGITELFFRYLYGDTFQGLDWKVPLFLFVILVAIGEDYNIYLVTRVIEEQKRLGPFAGLRRAIASTGGIITSCGVIMAGTFISMATGSLRGIAELGFALSLGVMLDTFVVRPVLVPAFLALLCRWRHGANEPQIEELSAEPDSEAAKEAAA